MVLRSGVVDFYGKVGDLRAAKRVIEEMLDIDVEANNAMISILSKYGCIKNARNLFDNMPSRNSELH